MMMRVLHARSNGCSARRDSKSARIPRPRLSSPRRRSRKPDCLVLDIQLGGMSGLELQQRLRKLGAPAPIIFVTAHDAPGVREEAERAGCSAYFLKPVHRKSLVEAITKAVHPGGG